MSIFNNQSKFKIESMFVVSTLFKEYCPQLRMCKCTMLALKFINLNYKKIKLRQI